LLFCNGKIKALHKSGRHVMLVSSGAVGLGRQRLGLAKNVVADPANVIDRQACAAAGQGILMSTYDTLFQRLNMTCAQVLITQSDFLSRERYSYLTDTLDRLISLGVTPIINENDVVTGCSELDTQRVFSDNDKLSALVAAGADADGLALLTDVEAVFTKPPGDPTAERIKVYDSQSSVVIGAQSALGRGGMASKIAAARISALGGVETVVASGYHLDNIGKIFAGHDVGTLFPASARPNKRQRWLTFATVTEGTIRVNAVCVCVSFV
jgi:glutamate 5-kinase